MTLALRAPIRGLVARAVLATVLLAASVGCECGGGREGEGGGEPTPPTADRTGTIVGIVRLAEGATIPEYPESPTQIAGRPALPQTCTPAQLSDRTPVVPAAETGGLTNLSIVVTGEDPARWPTAGEPVTRELRIHDCRLTPSIVVATRGDRLRLINENPENPFFIDLGDGMMQYRSEPREMALEQGGVHTVQCGFAAPCGRTEVITLYHPVHGTSGADGRFRIEDVPADQPVRVTAWHPLFQEASTTTTVAAGDTVEVELRIRPFAARVPAPAPAPAPTEGAEPGAPAQGDEPDAPAPVAPF